MKAEDLIGRKVLILDPHPWANHTGRVDRIEDTPWGPRPVIDLDVPGIGGQECFVMKPGEMQLLKKTRRGTRKRGRRK